MCGLVGMAGDLKPQHSIIFRSLLLLNTSRGWDSTGVLRVPVSEEVGATSAKALGTPYDLFNKSFMFDAKGLIDGSSKLLLGHNRYATMGGIGEDSAHPFTFDHITGAHNGTLRDWSDLEGFATHSVDSKALLQHVSSKGIKDAWKSFSGAAALSWWDEEEKTLNLIRNKERPLHLAYADNKSIVIWASEEWMIKAALESSPNVKLDPPTKELANPFQLKENYLHTFKLDKEIPKLITVKNLEARVEVKKNYGFKGGGYTNAWSPNYNERSVGGWARGLSKAPKTIIGTNFSITSGVVKYRKGVGSLYIINGTTTLGDTVRIYPTTRAEWEALKDVPFTRGMEKNVYEITRRPRVESGASYRKTYRLGPDGFTLSSGTEFLVYIDKDNTACNREDATLDLEYVGGRCSCCDTKLHVEDNYEYIYQGYAILCIDCVSNDELRNMMGVTE